MEKIAQEVFDILNKKELTISFCESATAGALSSLFAEIEGCSKVFKGALITYSNEAKIKVAKVRENTIINYGAISKQTAKEMAANTNKIMNTDICISITGNAGLNIIENKPVAFYYVGITLIDKTKVYEIKLVNNNRNQNRINIAWFALEELKKVLF